ncbi:MAG: hypothetical protein RSD35_09175 [Oscillospiraceae bacterium]
MRAAYAWGADFRPTQAQKHGNTIGIIGRWGTGRAAAGRIELALLIAVFALYALAHGFAAYELETQFTRGWDFGIVSSPTFDIEPKNTLGKTPRVFLY